MRITQSEAIERIEGVLEAAGITVSIGTCGCDTGFEAEFPDGAWAKTLCEAFEIECDGLEHQRG
jgi:coenzyme F420-reducing hydrogenase gamma subunit